MSNKDENKEDEKKSLFDSLLDGYIDYKFWGYLILLILVIISLLT